MRHGIRTFLSVCVCAAAIVGFAATETPKNSNAAGEFMPFRVGASGGASAAVAASVKPRMVLPFVAADKVYSSIPSAFVPTAPLVHGVNAAPTAIASSDANGAVGFKDTVSDLSVVVHVVDESGRPIPNLPVRVVISNGDVAAFPADQAARWVGFAAASTSGSVSAAAFPTAKALDIVLKAYDAFKLGQDVGEVIIDAPALLGVAPTGIEICVSPDQLVDQLQLVSGMAFTAAGLLTSPTVVGSLVMIGAGIAVDQLIELLVLDSVKDRIRARVNILAVDPTNPFRLAAPVPIVEILPNNSECPKNSPVIPKPLHPTGIDVSLGTATELVVRWNDQSSNEDGFIIQLDGPRAAGEALPTYRVGKNAQSFTATGLKPNTQYCAFVYAYNAGGPSTANIGTFDCETTLRAEAAPPPPIGYPIPMSPPRSFPGTILK